MKPSSSTRPHAPLVVHVIGPGLLRRRGIRPDRLGKNRRAGEAQGDAQPLLGKRYCAGDGVPERDYAKGAGLLRQAAEQGNVLAQNNLGYLYYQGLGVS